MNYTLIRAHKRTLSLQVNATGQLIARAPMLLPKFMIDRFIKEKSSWVEKRIKEMQKPRGEKVKYFTEAKIKTYIESEIKKYSLIMGLKPADLRYTHVRTYWGTCAPSGGLSFNLALCYVPREAVSYVVVHELAHLRWRGHGKRFWEMVTKYCPKTKEMKKILHLTRTIAVGSKRPGPAL